MLAIGARRHTRAPHRSRYGRRRATTRSRSRRDNAHPRSGDQNRAAPLAKCRRSAVVSLFGYDCRVNSIPTHHFKSVIRHGKQPQPPKGLEPPIDASRQSRSHLAACSCFIALKPFTQQRPRVRSRTAHQNHMLSLAGLTRGRRQLQAVRSGGQLVTGMLAGVRSSDGGFLEAGFQAPGTGKTWDAPFNVVRALRRPAQ